MNDIIKIGRLDAQEDKKCYLENGQLVSLKMLNLLEEKNKEIRKLREALILLRENLKWDSGNSEIIKEALKEVGEK
jgi:hypothetical protein